MKKSDILGLLIEVLFTQRTENRIMEFPYVTGSYIDDDLRFRYSFSKFRSDKVMELINMLQRFEYDELSDLKHTLGLAVAELGYKHDFYNQVIENEDSKS